MSAFQVLELGDSEGHPFRGNQYTAQYATDLPDTPDKAAALAHIDELKDDLNLIKLRDVLPAFNARETSGKMLKELNAEPVSTSVERVPFKTLHALQQVVDSGKVKDIIEKEPYTSDPYVKNGTEAHLPTVFERDGVHYLLDGNHRAVALKLQGATGMTAEVKHLPPTVTAAAQEFGDTEGHPFHGNQWTGLGSPTDAQRERAATRFREGAKMFRGGFGDITVGSPEHLQAAKRAWIGGNSGGTGPAMRQAARDMRNGILPTRHREAMAHADARVMIKAIQDAEPTKGPLYRAQVETPVEVAMLQPGHQFDLPLAGFSQSEDVAHTFFQDPSWKGREGGTWNVTYALAPGAQAVNLPGSQYHELEAVTGGTFRVTNVESHPWTATDRAGMGGNVRVSIEQVKPPSVTASALELGEDAGHPFRGNQYTGGLPHDEDPKTPGRQVTVLHSTTAARAKSIRENGFDVLHGGGAGDVLGRGGYGSLPSESGNVTQEVMKQGKVQLALQVTLNKPLLAHGDDLKDAPGFSMPEAIARHYLGVSEDEWYAAEQKASERDDAGSNGLALRDIALRKGYDSIVWNKAEHDSDSLLGDQVVVFNSNQVKVLDSVTAAAEQPLQLVGLLELFPQEKRKEDFGEGDGHPFRGNQWTDRGADDRIGSPQRVSRFVGPNGKPMSRSQIGDTMEAIVVGHPAVREALRARYGGPITPLVGHQAGKARQGPLDILVGNHGAELKSVHAESTSQKTTIKREEADRKTAAAAELGLRPLQLGLVWEPTSDGGALVHLYGKEGFVPGAFATTFDHLGTIPVTHDDFASAFKRAGYGN